MALVHLTEGFKTGSQRRLFYIRKLVLHFTVADGVKSLVSASSPVQADDHVLSAGEDPPRDGQDSQESRDQ